MSLFKEFGSASRSNAAPVTTAIVVLMIAGFGAIWLTHSVSLIANLSFETSGFFAKPWTVLTYPFSFLPDSNGFISLLFAGVWLWQMGGTVERELGSARFLAVWALFTALCGVFVWIGALILSVPAGQIVGPWPAIAAVTVIWGSRNPDLSMVFMFVIPLAAKWLAWISVALVFFGTTPPQIAPFGAIPYILAYFYATNRITFAPYSPGEAKYRRAAQKTERYDKSYYEEVHRREKDREERERLRKLFEGSIKDDDEK